MCQRFWHIFCQSVQSKPKANISNQKGLDHWCNGCGAVSNTQLLTKQWNETNKEKNIWFKCIKEVHLKGSISYCELSIYATKTIQLILHMCKLYCHFIFKSNLMLVGCLFSYCGEMKCVIILCVVHLFWMTSTHKSWANMYEEQTKLKVDSPLSWFAKQGISTALLACVFPSHQQPQK